MDIKTNISDNKLTLIRELFYFYCLGIFICKKLFVEVTLWSPTYEQIWPFSDFITVQYTEVISIILIGCIIYTFFTTQPSLLRMMIFTVMVLIGRKIADVQGNIYYYNAILLVVAAYGVRAKRLLIWASSLCGIILISTVVASKIGILHNEISGGRHREYLGFSWTTTPVMIFSYVVFAFIILKSCRLHIAEFAIINAANFWLFLMTNTKFSFLIILLISTICFVYRYVYEINQVPKIRKHFVILLPWLFTLFIYYLSYVYDHNVSWMVRLNILLSKRLSQCRYSLRLYEILPFGQPISWVTTGEATPDNPATYVDTAYLQTLLKCGWIPLVMLLLLSSFLIYRAFCERRHYIAVVFVFILIFGLFEQQLFWYEYDIILLLAFADWSKLPEVKVDNRSEGNKWESRAFLKQIL